MNKLYVVGLGPGHPDYITSAAVKVIVESDILIGGKRNLQPFEDLHKEKVVLNSSIKEILQWAKEKMTYQKIAVLVSGDPGFYSLLDACLREIGETNLEVIPGLSSFQYLFSKLKKPWKNYYLGSLHGREIDFVSLLDSYPGIFLLTDHVYSPSKIAAELIRQGKSQCKMIVGENLSYSDERIIKGNPKAIKQQSFNSLSVVVIENEVGI